MDPTTVGTVVPLKGDDKQSARLGLEGSEGHVLASSVVEDGRLTSAKGFY